MSWGSFLPLVAQLGVLLILGFALYKVTTRNNAAQMDEKIAAVKADAEEKAEKAQERLLTTLEGELDAVRSRANRLHNDLESERAFSAERDREILKLRSATDLTQLQAQIGAQFASIADTLAKITSTLQAMERRINSSAKPAREQDG